MSGSLNLFNHRTNVDYKNARVLCIDLKRLGAGLRTIAMHVMNDLTNSQVSYNFAHGIATWCYYDEFHVLLQDELTSSYFVTIWKMLRKKGCVPSALTQNVKDLLASRQIENIFENSDFGASVAGAGRQADFGEAVGDQSPPALLCDPLQPRRGPSVLRKCDHPVC